MSDLRQMFSPPTTLFLFLCFGLVGAQLGASRRYAFLPLLIATCHLPNVPVIELGVAFSITKLLILTGLLRALYERRRVWSPHNQLDVFIAVWAVWAVVSGFFHDPRDHNPITVRLSLAYELFGAYIYARAFIRGHEDVVRCGRCLAGVLLPLAALMLAQAVTGDNVYAALGAPLTEIRNGNIRANGPFAHPILAGTVGASCLLLVRPVLRRRSLLGVLGTAACVTIALCSRSSGPLLTLLTLLIGGSLWRWRSQLPLIRVACVVALLCLHMVMNAPVWYLLARIDLAGGSTGYHRAELITQAVNHLDEWWGTGTDYTRHWMPYGVGWSGDQVDVTNYYLKMGVTGGLPLMLSFIALFVKAFQLLGRRMREMRRKRDPREFTLWCVGATLASYCVTSISITYFDQSYVIFSMLLGTVPGLTSRYSRAPQHCQAVASGPGRLI